MTPLKPTYERGGEVEFEPLVRNVVKNMRTALSLSQDLFPSETHRQLEIALDNVFLESPPVIRKAMGDNVSFSVPPTEDESAAPNAPKPGIYFNTELYKDRLREDYSIFSPRYWFHEDLADALAGFLASKAGPFAPEEITPLPQYFNLPQKEAKDHAIFSFGWGYIRTTTNRGSFMKLPLSPHIYLEEQIRRLIARTPINVVYYGFIAMMRAGLPLSAEGSFVLGKELLRNNYRAAPQLVEDNLLGLQFLEATEGQSTREKLHRLYYLTGLPLHIFWNEAIAAEKRMFNIITEKLLMGMDLNRGSMPPRILII